MVRAAGGAARPVEAARALSGAIVGRPAAAGGDRPRPDPRAEGAALRREREHARRRNPGGGAGAAARAAGAAGARPAVADRLVHDQERDRPAEPAERQADLNGPI
mgnify:CR=1 FL=1